VPIRLADQQRLEAYLARREVTTRGAASIAPRPLGAEAIPLSFAQQQIWLHALRAPDLPLYNEPLTIRRTGPLDLGALQWALDEIIRRHEAWRTTFAEHGGRPVQLVRPPFSVGLPVVDLGEWPPDSREAEALRLATEDARRPFDLEHGPLVRALLVRLDPEEHRLFLTVHHIVLDGVSIYRVLLPELTALYEARLARRPSPLPDLADQLIVTGSIEHHDGQIADGHSFCRRNPAQVLLHRGLYVDETGGFNRDLEQFAKEKRRDHYRRRRY